VKFKFTSTLLAFLFFSLFASATIHPGSFKNQTYLPERISKKPGLFQRIADKKNILVQRLLYKIINKKLNPQPERGLMTEQQRRQAKWSMTLGIASILFLFTPIAILSLPASIVGLVLGIKSVKGNSNTKGIVGIITSSLTILLFLLVIVLLAIYLTFNF
jgi:hypothetical protein